MRFEKSTTYRISADIQYINKDLLIILTGGNVPHIGTVTVNETNKMKTYQFHSHSGRHHKDNVLAEIILKDLNQHFKGNCVILSGVHVDQITKQEIKESFLLVQEIAQDIYHWIDEHQPQFKDPLYYKNNHEINEK